MITVIIFSMTDKYATPVECAVGGRKFLYSLIGCVSAMSHIPKIPTVQQGSSVNMVALNIRLLISFAEHNI